MMPRAPARVECALSLQWRGWEAWRAHEGGGQVGATEEVGHACVACVCEGAGSKLMQQLLEHLLVAWQLLATVARATESPLRPLTSPAWE